MPQGCIVHHLTCTVEPKGCTGFGQSIYRLFASVGAVEYCARQNATPGNASSESFDIKGRGQNTAEHPFLQGAQIHHQCTKTIL